MSKRILFILLGACLLTHTTGAAPAQDLLIDTIRSDAPLQVKWTAAHQLARIATSDAVPKLAPLLTDDQRSELVRFVLEPLPFSSVDRALRAALTNAKGRALQGDITSLGARRDAKAVPLLVRYLDDEDLSVTSSVVAALGRIGTVRAAKALQAHLSNETVQIRPEFWAALVQCADQLRQDGHQKDAFAVFHWIVSANNPVGIHEAAIRGLILTGGKQEPKLLAGYLQSDAKVVIGLAQTGLPGADATKTLVTGLPKLSLDYQVLLVEALGRRDDAEARAALICLAKNADKAVRLTAIRSLTNVEALIDAISDADQDIAKEACDCLASVPGVDADKAILKLFDRDNSGLRLAAIKMASRRRLHAATPDLAKAAASSDADLSSAALTALGETASEMDVDTLIELLSSPSVDADAVQSLLVAVGGHARDPNAYIDRIIDEFGRSPIGARQTLWHVLSDVGGVPALEKVRNKWPDAQGMPSITAQAGEYAFFPFCIDWHDAKKRTYAEQAVMLKELGYDGVGHIYLDGVAERLKTLDAAGLKLFQITMTVDISGKKAPYDARFKDVLELVKGRHVQFDLLLGGLPPSDLSGDGRAVKILREMSDLAKASGAQLLLYPHQGLWVERIEDSMRVADKVDRPNVGVMFNLCHWLRADKQRNYKPLLAAALPRLWAVSICGADNFDPSPGWAHYIQPLDRGSFDVGLLLRTLQDLGYKGPIGLQCYGIGGDAREHLARSMAAWRKLKVNLNAPADKPGYDDTPCLPNSVWRVHDRNRPQPPMVNPGQGAAPPDDAIVLFDGRDLSQWAGGNEHGVEDGCINILKTGELSTRQYFGDCQLHVEWATPAAPEDRMEWGNSGVFFLGLYELQIIESHDSHIYADGNAGAIYGQTPALVNASRRPGEWQSFDVVFTAPQFNGEKLVKPACFTVLQNGVLVQNHQAALGPTVHHALPSYNAASRISKGPITLQCHGSPVHFRNIWIRPLDR